MDSLLEIVLQSVCLMYEALFNKFGLIRSDQKCASNCVADLNKEKCNLLTLCDNLINLGLFLCSDFLLHQAI